MNEHLKTAYILGAQAAAQDFEKLSFVPGSTRPPPFSMAGPTPVRQPTTTAMKPPATNPPPRPLPTTPTPADPAAAQMRAATRGRTAPARPAPARPAAPQMQMKTYGPGTKQYQQAMQAARTAKPVPSAAEAERTTYKNRYEAIKAMEAEQARGGMSLERAKYWGNIMKGY